MQKCPFCDRESTDAAVLCTCGYNFREGTPFVPKVPLASRGSRLGAQTIDGLVAAALFWITVPLQRIDERFLGLGLILSAGYFLLSDGLPGGQSLGKRLLDIAVIDEKTRKPCSLGQSVLRNFTAFLGAIDWLLIFGKKQKRIGDVVANTCVISVLEWRPPNERHPTASSGGAGESSGR